jgi:hypothetical protein
MAESQSKGGHPAVNPVRDILEFDRARLRVTPKFDIGGIELSVRAIGHAPTRIVLAPVQAGALAKRLIDAAVDVVAEEAGL